MAAATLEYTVASQERVLSALRQSQTALVDVVSTWAKAVENATPDLPAVPVLASLPSLQEIVANGYDFAGKVLQAHSQFAAELIAAAAPAVKTTPVELPAAK